MNPLNLWVGGKRKDIPYFKEYYPKNYTKYIEPFVGGGAVFFDLEERGSVINDTQKNLINFYRQIAKGEGSEIYSLLEKASFGKEAFYEMRNNYVPKNEVERAYRFYYILRCAFGGHLKYNRRGECKASFGREFKRYEVLLDKKYEDLLKETTIECKSFECIFEEYNNEDYFMFLDPPYDNVSIKYGFGEFGREEHKKLADCFKQTKTQCLLAIGNTPFIEELYKDFIIGCYDKNYVLNNAVESSENILVIANYEAVEQRKVA